jgi:hypothetical protein
LPLPPLPPGSVQAGAENHGAAQRDPSAPPSGTREWRLQPEASTVHVAGRTVGVLTADASSQATSDYHVLHLQRGSECVRRCDSARSVPFHFVA